MNGIVLWWDNRDGKGIVEDDAGNEYYIDASVLVPRDIREKLKSKTQVTFEVNTEIKNCLCACQVSIN